MYEPTTSQSEILLLTEKLTNQEREIADLKKELAQLKESVLKPITENWKNVISIPFQNDNVVEYIAPVSGWYSFTFGLNYNSKVYITRDSAITYLMGDANNYATICGHGDLTTYQVPMMKGDKFTVEKQGANGWAGCVLNIKYKEI